MEMSQHNIQKIAEEIQKIHNFCEDDEELSYDELTAKVEEQLNVLKCHAEEMGLPLKVTAYDIISKYREEEYEDESSYYEDEDSYYEEESY